MKDNIDIQVETTVESTEELEIQKTAVVEMVDTFKNATGLELVRQGTKWIAIGAFMGTSDAIPGYSGGTTLALLGFFRKLILIAKSMFIPEPGITRWKAIMFFIPFAIGWVAGVFGFAKLTELMAENHLGLELIFFFSPFILFTIPIFLKAEKPELTINRKFVKTRRWLWFSLGFLIILGIGLWTLLGTDGVDFDRTKEDKPFNLSENWHWAKLMGVAFLAGMVSLIPGGSGALIQLLSGMYKNIHWMIMAHVGTHVAALFVFAGSTLVGMLTMVFIMAWGLKKHKKVLAALSLGMLIASIGVIFMVPSHKLWGELGTVTHYVGIPLAVFLGSGSGIVLNLFINRRNKQHKNVVNEVRI